MQPIIAVVCVTALAAYILFLLCAVPQSSDIRVVVPLCSDTAQQTIEETARRMPSAVIVALDTGDENAAVIAEILRRKYPRLYISNCDTIAADLGCQNFIDKCQQEVYNN